MVLKKSSKQLSQQMESVAAPAPNLSGSQSHMLAAQPGTSPTPFHPNDSSKTEPASAQSHEMSELETFSRALLHHIVYGNNSVGQDRLLRALYWDTIKTLADPESNYGDGP